MGKYQRMTLAVRCQIHALLQVGVSISEISKEVGFHKSSVYRELQRNTQSKKYCPRKATKLYIKRQQNQGRHTIINSVLEGQIIDKLISLSSIDNISIKQVPEYTRPTTVPRLICDTSKFRKLTGWKPEISVDKILEDTLEYWRDFVKNNDY